MAKDIVSGYEGRKILVAGGSGYLGTNLIDKLSGVDCAILRLARTVRRTAPKASRAAITDIAGDVRERDIWDRALDGVDIIFYFAAQTSTYRANEDPVEDHDVNVLPMLRLLETCRRKKICPAIMFAGTVTEAGMPGRMPLAETQADAPVTVYDLHKLMAETYLKYYIQENIVRGASLRLSNVYGPGPKSGNADRGILNMMILKAIGGETLTIYGRGEHIRDYLYVDDAIGAFLAGGLRVEDMNGKHFVIGSGKGHSIAEAFGIIADRVFAKTGRRAAISHIDPPVPQSPIEARNFVADPRAFAGATGWRPAFDLQEGVDRTIDSFIADA